MTSRLSSGARLVKRAKHEVEQSGTGKTRIDPRLQCFDSAPDFISRQQSRQRQRNSSFL